MKRTTKVEAHGGSLVNLMVDEERAVVLKAVSYTHLTLPTN